MIQIDLFRYLLFKTDQQQTEIHIGSQKTMPMLIQATTIWTKITDMNTTE